MILYDRTHVQVEVDEPDERVLVHRLDVREVRDAEEEDRRVGGNWLVPISRFIDLPFGCRRDLLLRGDLLGQRLG